MLQGTGINMAFARMLVCGTFLPDELILSIYYLLFSLHTKQQENQIEANAQTQFKNSQTNKSAKIPPSGTVTAKSEPHPIRRRRA